MEGAQKRDRTERAVPDPSTPAASVVVEGAESGGEIELHDHEPALAQFQKDVLRGLASDPKFLPSQYLYDERGAMLFEVICTLDEYYLTRTEFSILRRNILDIADCIGPEAMVIEPGSGSGVKARLLLAGLERPAGFVPVDIARTQLVEVAVAINERSPDLTVLPVCADFTSAFQLPPEAAKARRRIGFLPGSTIGNFEPDAAVEVLRDLARTCEPDGGILIGVDLQKDRSILEPAYDDAGGVSRDFALNYLVRINEELGADFDLDQFSYQAPYDETQGRIEMALVSECEQTVHIGDATVTFSAGELVSTEWSYKYDLPGFAALARRAGLVVQQVWTDAEHLFSVQYLVPG